MLRINGQEIKGIILDIDGTLMDSFSVFTTVFNEGVSQFNVQPVSQLLLTQVLRKGTDLHGMLRMVFPPQSDESLINKCKESILEHFFSIEATEIKPFPGIKELFKHLIGRGLRIGIATGRTSPPEKEWERFKGFGLDSFIDSIVTSREVARRKPAPDAMIECASRMKVPVETCLIVGDTEDDVVAARRAGGIPVVILGKEDRLDLSESEKPALMFENLIEFTLFLEERG